jgi:hypothetical protein
MRSTKGELRKLVGLGILGVKLGENWRTKELIEVKKEGVLE